MSDGGRRYSRDEAAEILRRVVERSDALDDDALTHEELVAAAREAGLDEGVVEDAAAELDARREQHEARTKLVAKRRAGLASHASSYTLVQVFLFAIDALTGPAWWFFYPLLGWGLFLAFHAMRALRAPTDDEVTRFARHEQRRVAKSKRRDARRSRREAAERARDEPVAHHSGRTSSSRPARSPVEIEFERVVQAGVASLLERIANRIEGSAHGEPRRADTDFGRYVDRVERASTSPPRAAGPRVRLQYHRRVDDDADEVEPVRSPEAERTRRKRG